MATSNIPNQANFQSTQNFNVDIDAIYSDFIQEIDANRSVVNIQVGQSALNVLDVTTVAGLSKFLKIENSPQESRVHCFYRLIGFPIIDNNFIYYNPGLDTTDDKDKQMTLSVKIGIANNPLPGFRAISSQRENYLNSILSVFAVRPATITATALALTSSTKIRSFTVPITKSDDPFDFSSANQSYSADIFNFKSTIGQNDQALLLDYQDENGVKPDPSKLKNTRFHFIKPFIVDARIDFSCNPANRKVAVPFVPTKANLLVGENTFVKRPLIEKVIRERFATQDQFSTVGTAGQAFVDYIKSVPAVKNEGIIQQMASGDIYKIGDQLQFKKYFDMIRAMVDKLVKAQLDVQKIQSLYYWLPLPSSIGPENGSDVKGIVISQTLPDGDNNSFITDRDRAIIDATLTQAANQFNIQTADTQGTPDVGGFSFDFFQSFDKETSDAYGDNTTKQLNSLNKIRTQLMKTANNSLRTIEIIMGEFSGLGLCDIIAVMGALYLMPQTSLVGFLDPDAYTRAVNAQIIDKGHFPNPGIQKAQTDFIAKVKDFYNLMDDIYKDAAQRNNLTGLNA